MFHKIQTTQRILVPNLLDLLSLSFVLFIKYKIQIPHPALTHAVPFAWNASLSALSTSSLFFETQLRCHLGDLTSALQEKIITYPFRLLSMILFICVPISPKSFLRILGKHILLISISSVPSSVLGNQYILIKVKHRRLSIFLMWRIRERIKIN